MTDTTKSTKSRIPEFANYEEEAAWWDTHDITEYLDEFEPPKLVRAQKKVISVYTDDAKKLGSALAIRFDEQTTQKFTPTGTPERYRPDDLRPDAYYGRVRPLRTRKDIGLEHGNLTCSLMCCPLIHLLELRSVVAANGVQPFGLPQLE